MSEERKFACSAAGRGASLMIASLALNLFLIGVLAGPLLGAGPFVHDRPHGFPPPPGGPDFIFAQVAEILPQPEAEKLREILSKERRELGNHRDAMHALMVKLAGILRTEKPDLAALHQILEEARGLSNPVHENFSRILEQITTQLSLESRRKIAEKLENPFPFQGRAFPSREKTPPMP